MTKSTTRSLFVAVFLLFILAACEPADTGPESDMGNDENSAQVTSTLGGQWVLMTLAGEPAPPLHRQPSLVFADEGAVGGFAGVNTFRSQFRQKPNSNQVTFEQGALTMMAGPDEAMSFERAYMDALANVNSYEMRDDKLILKGDEGLELIFEAGTP